MSGDLPQEVWLGVLGFLEDTDLQSLCLVNRSFRALCSDPLTWSHLRHRIQIPRLQIRLNGRVRRSRSALAERSILRSCGSPSILSRQIQAGHYISGPTGVLLFETQRLLESKMRAASLNVALRKRRSWTELMDSGLLMVPASTTTHKRPVSPLVAPIQVQLAKQFKEITLSRKLKARTPLPTLLETTAVLSPCDLHCASLVCPGIRPKIQFFEGLVSPR